MTSRVVLVRNEPELTHGARQNARDGWRVFHSPKTGFEIAIAAYQLARVEAIAKRERTEWYALVVGEVLRDEHGVHAVVRDVVPNDWAERGRAHVHMAANAETQVRELAGQLHPLLRPLGNLHTHPRFTTQPSGTDREEFWNDAHSVSIIVDPHDKPTVAVYRGREGERLIELAPDVRAEALHTMPPALPTSPSTSVQARASDGLGVRETLNVMALALVLVGSFSALGYLVQKQVTGVAQSADFLRERVAVLEAQAALSAPHKAEAPSPKSSPLECSAPEP